ncbi:hypothetical protein ACFRAO_38965 [Streptomyces sp. NPDC056656]|uniref:hypothetical protein n=1 Tax=Streptomyces sp. NPDC056656 TaxID=3345895 RepID=UPI0036C1FD46
MSRTQDCWTSFIVSVCRCSTRHVQIRPVLSKASGRGPGRRAVMHAVDCEEVPARALMLLLLERIELPFGIHAGPDPCVFTRRRPSR